MVFLFLWLFWWGEFEDEKDIGNSPEQSLWRKELPSVTMVGRSSTRWSFTTLELAAGPAKILS
jgi:hypothetical protein